MELAASVLAGMDAEVSSDGRGPMIVASGGRGGLCFEGESCESRTRVEVVESRGLSGLEVYCWSGGGMFTGNGNNEFLFLFRRPGTQAKAVRE